MIGLNKIGLNQVQLNRLRLNAPFPAYGKMAGGGGSGDGFPQLPGDVTRWHFGGLTNEMMAAMDDPRIEDADHKGRFLSFNERRLDDCWRLGIVIKCSDQLWHCKSSKCLSV